MVAYRDGGGAKVGMLPIQTERLQMLLDTLQVRAGSVNAMAEITAMMSLRPKVSEGQWESYILSGAFPEYSPRSRVTYILRKGLPTIALRCTKTEDGHERRRYLTALCLHPLAYFENTWAGCTPPTDEVIAHLMLIRADEHRLWKKSGQHPMDDPRAAI